MKLYGVELFREASGLCGSHEPVGRGTGGPGFRATRFGGSRIRNSGLGVQENGLLNPSVPSTPPPVATEGGDALRRSALYLL